MALRGVHQRVAAPVAGTSNEPARLTLLTGDASLARSLVGWLGADRYRLSVRSTAESLPKAVGEGTIDALLLDLSAPNGVRADALKALANGGRDPAVPAIGLCQEDTAAAARLTALKDGLWDVVELPGGSTELAAKLGVWVLSKRNVNAVLSAPLLDSETGRHVPQGNGYWARELAVLCESAEHALSCAVFGADRLPEGVTPTPEALLAAGRRFGRVLLQRTRSTDVVGHLEPLKFMVVAPETPTVGAVRMAERFTLNWRWRRTTGELQVTFSAGVAGLDHLDGKGGASSDRLLEAARQALDRARAAGTVRVAVANQSVEQTKQGGDTRGEEEGD